MNVPFHNAKGLLKRSITEAINFKPGFLLHHWPKFSGALGGLRLNEFTLISAPTGSGKTTWIAQLALQMLINKIPFFAAPVETGPTDFVRRMVEIQTGEVVNDGNPVPQAKGDRLIRSFEEFFDGAPYWISDYDTRVDRDEMIAMLRLMSQTYGAKIALLDNLNFFLEIKSAHMERAEMDTAIHQFVMEAKRFPMHIILIVHPKKTGDGRINSEEDIKGSSNAAQEASNVFLLNRPTIKQIEDGQFRTSDRELVVKKCRRRGWLYNRSFWFEMQGMRYVEFDPKERNNTKPYATKGNTK